MDYSISSESESFEMETSYQELSVNGLTLCRGCSKEIHEKYYLRVNETSWHEECLKCQYCEIKLNIEETCFFKKSKMLCKNDYYKHFGVKCAKCTRNIQTSDWVRRAKDNVYHLACFACDSCKRQLSTGEEFALQNNQVLCKTHYCESIDGDYNGKEGENSKSKNKRVRTTFTEEQLQVLQANFDFDSNPDGQDLERIAQVTGLSKRVTQVWFQNSRARQKKYKEKKNDANSITDMNDGDSNDENWNGNLEILNKTQQFQPMNQFQPNDFTLMGENKTNIDTIFKENKNIRQKNLNNLENEINLSWGSNDSLSDNVNENSMYDSSMELNQEL